MDGGINKPPSSHADIQQGAAAGGWSCWAGADHGRHSSAPVPHCLERSGTEHHQVLRGCPIQRHCRAVHAPTGKNASWTRESGRGICERHVQRRGHFHGRGMRKHHTKFGLAVGVAALVHIADAARPLDWLPKLVAASLQPSRSRPGWLYGAQGQSGTCGDMPDANAGQDAASHGRVGSRLSRLWLRILWLGLLCWIFVAEPLPELHDLVGC
mmetsp:Transcript_8221/g.19291  ORF Transcript_8221/g.19291 Transcript_8221/m.19291 type:complete len:212 (+) Transcript_8221:479-1114(+)